MIDERAVAVASLVLGCLATFAEQARNTDDVLLYAPDIVAADVPRLFLVALRVPASAPAVKVAHPDCVELLDRTKLPATGDVRKFYFRTRKPARKAELRFALSDREIVVPLEIWSFADLRAFRTLKGKQLPRRWPLGERLPELKRGRTVTTPAELEARKKAKPRGTKWLERSDDDLWAMQPDSTIPRWHWVNLPKGCPVHGTEIYKNRAYYPWKTDCSWPWRWKIRCPVGGEEYPSNDFANGDMTGGPFADGGIDGGHVRDGQHYGFIAEICQAYCHQMLRVAPDCAQSYLATGDGQYAHKALVALSRLAVEYAYLATMTHHRHRNNERQVERLGQSRFGDGPFLQGSGFTVYSISQPGVLISNAEAYDRIFPAVDKDPAMIPFLRRKGFDVRTHRDVRLFIEENLFAVWMQGVMDGACHCNEPSAQQAFARAAEVLDYARGTDFMDWLYDAGGKMRVFVVNGYFRDGAPYEATGGYNGHHVYSLAPIVDSIERLRKMRPNVYPESKYPALGRSRRYHNIFDFDMGTVTIDRDFPSIGDHGGWAAYHRSTKRRTWQCGKAATYEHAYRLFRDPKLAGALAHQPGWKPSLDFPFSRDEIEREAAKWPDDWNDGSSLHDGFGIAILRSGKGDAKRAFWMMYGRSRGHTHDDIMDIGLQGFQGTLLSHMGYPRNWGHWEKNWATHHVARQFSPSASMTAQAQFLADAGPAHVTEARAQAVNDRLSEGEGYLLPPDSWQRRTLALVDVGPDTFYGVDFYRMCGGAEHWQSFFAQEGAFTTGGIALTQQKRGTLAGADVPYGDEKWLKANGCRHDKRGGWHGSRFPFAHLYNVQHGRSKGVWSADWALKKGDGLHLRLTTVDASGADVAICDGTSPAGGDPYEMKWIMLNRKGEAPLKTQVLSLIEPYVETPIIRGANLLKLSGADEAGFAASACVVRLAEFTDTILASADPSVARSAEGGLQFAGRFGLWRERDGRPVAMVLVGGTTLAKGAFGIATQAPEYRGRITKIDREKEAVLVSPAPPKLEAIVGATVFVTGPVRRSAYTVLEARSTADGAALRLDLDSRIGTGPVTRAEDFLVRSPVHFPLQGKRYYHGARLVNAERNAEYRLAGLRSGEGATIDRGAHPEATAEKLAREFHKDTWFDIYDYGLGDEVVWPYAISVTETKPQVYKVSAPVPVDVKLPEGCRLE
ncbi:MAG: hypothetical protein JXR37_33880 [Kiritimatiellae bacterium]|nr:hypothetical protein [Kiritimatiellia bacterium]